MVEEDPRRRIPGTDTVLGHPEVRDAAHSLGEPVLQRIIHQAQSRARSRIISPEQVVPEVIAQLEGHRPSSLRPVINATGVVIHTNLGRAPLSPAARQAVVDAAGYVDVEMDLRTGRRSQRGAGARRALLDACSPAEDALIVNNGAAALALAAAALIGSGRVIISRGELVEIGAGFRLPELIESTGAELMEVGTTNRTHLQDYASAVEAIPQDERACILKVHPSNYRIAGFTSAVPTAELAGLAHRHGLPLVVDAGSGVLDPEPALPEEPDLSGALSDGADLVIASGDKLLGGPQAGLLLGSTDTITELKRHPLARAVRTDKLTLAALEATLTGGPPPVTTSLHADPDDLLFRARRIAEAVGVDVVAHDGRVGGGGGAEVPLPGWAVQLPESAAEPLRSHNPPVVTRTSGSWCLLDLRCVPESDDETVLQAVRSVLHDLHAAPSGEDV